MASDLSQLELRYLNSCKQQQVLPCYPILSSFSKVNQNFRILEIFIDQLICSDIPPLVDAIATTNLDEIDAVDVCQRSPNPSLNGECILSLLHAVSPKLRVVDLIDWSFWKNILKDICGRGLACRILNLRFSPIRELNITGKFMQLHKLNLDFSIHLTSFHVNCFSCMPNLMQLSLCATRVSNLWTATAALSKLPSLVELRFQNCLCCYGTGSCPKSEGFLTPYKRTSFGQQNLYTDARQLSQDNENFLLDNLLHGMEETPSYSHFDGDADTSHMLLQIAAEETSDNRETNLLSHWEGIGDRMRDANLNLNPFERNMFSAGNSSTHTSYQFFEEIAYSSRGRGNGICEIDEIEGLNDNNNNNNLNGNASLHEFSSQFSFSNHYFAGKFLNKIQDGYLGDVLASDDATGISDFAPKNSISHHPSPICFEKYYREYMISSLAGLKVLDNLLVQDLEREKANETIRKYYVHVPYNRHFKDKVVSILQMREVGISGVSFRYSHSKQPFFRASHSYTRSLSAAKVCSSLWPHMHPISKFTGQMEESKMFHPRQFEYHPANQSLMVFGTLNGEIVVINHESQKLVGYIPSVGVPHSILGLCWLKKYPSKLIAGSDNGSLQLYDVSQIPSTITDRFCCLDACVHTFDEFEQLTSVHINSTDDYFLASGFSKHVALYDICSGRRLQFLKNLHQEHINVVKFSHHSPAIFATASFDQDVKLWDLRQGISRPCFTACSSRGNVMVCFSPDDHYLLASAIDNEVKQLLAVDGRLDMKFDIDSIGSAQNYTRSYYMNGRDYIISGSCEENVVRVCCAQTGRRLRDISLEACSLQGRDSRCSMYVQSLRGDPYRAFHMSVLAAYLRPCTRSEIIKVNMMASGDHTEDDNTQCCPASSSMGG